MSPFAGTLLVARAEAARLVRLRSTWLVAAALAGLSGLRAFVAVGSTAAERASGEDPLSSGAAWAPLVDGWSLGLVLGTLVLLLHASRGIASDRERGVLRLAVTRSATRQALVLGRALLAPVLVLATVALTGVAAWLVARAHGDFGAFVEDGFEILTAEDLGTELSNAVRAVLVPLLATYAFGLFVACLARGAAVAQAAALGSFLAFDLFKGVLGDDAYWVFAAHVPTPADGSAWSELVGVARGFSDAGFPPELVRVGWQVSAPAVLVFLVVGALVLRRRAL